MAIVENNVVKLEWEKSGWLQTKGKGGKEGAFIFASKDYESTKFGTVTVFFSPYIAFIWDSGEDGDVDLWNAAELKNWAKTELDGSFPDNYEECVTVIDSGENDAVVSVLEKYGIEAHKEDIEKRILDIRPYGEETEFKF